MAHALALFQTPASLPSAVKAVLEEEIIFGRLRPGSRLVETELAAKYKVSRSPIREALIHLEKDMLVLREPRKGFCVATLTVEELNEIYSCRMALEGVAAQWAAERRSDDDCKQMNASLRALTAAVVKRDVDTYFRWNVGLTNQIHAAADNDTLNRLLDGIGKSALRYRYLVFTRRSDRLAASLAGNRKIVSAINAHDGLEARRLTENLISDSRRAIESTLQEVVAAAVSAT